MRVYSFGHAPEAVQDGFGPTINIFNGSLEDAKKKYADKDVALVYGAKHFGKESDYEFTVMNRA